jgi:hypothetical protein
MLGVTGRKVEFQMADLVDLFIDSANGLLRPREFSEKRFAPGGFAALKAALTFVMAAIGLLLIGTGVTGEKNSCNVRSHGSAICSDGCLVVFIPNETWHQFSSVSGYLRADFGLFDCLGRKSGLSKLWRFYL